MHEREDIKTGQVMWDEWHVQLNREREYGYTHNMNAVGERAG